MPQYEYGKYYAKGIKAKEWLLKSSEEGFSEALTEIGRKYDSGFFEQNPDSAYYYYYSAAKRITLMVFLNFRYVIQMENAANRVIRTH